MKVQWKIKNELPELERMAALIDAFGREHDLEEEMIGDVRLALDEVITNIIQHGYEDAEEHSIDVDLELTPEYLNIRVEDDGKPFDPLQAVSADIETPFEENEIGGWGIYLAKQVMDEISYRQKDGLNQLTLKKYGN